MPAIQVSETETFNSSTISDTMFGTNFVTTLDVSFKDNLEQIELLRDIGVQNLRYPGGSATELIFPSAVYPGQNWNATHGIDEHGNIRELTPMDTFFEIAGHIGVSATLVIPTRIAFEASAGQALAGGIYGSRTELADGYLNFISAYVTEALRHAADQGVEISKLELGNEFWGSGEMAASEYGYLAGILAEFLDREFPGIDIIMQMAGSTSSFSPRTDQTVYLEQVAGGDFIVHTDPEEVEAGWIATTMPGNGNAATQTREIASQIVANGNAVHVIDGVVEHVYFDAGFDGIDDQRDFALTTVYNVFVDTLGLPRGELDYHVTEWSPRNPRGSDMSLNLGNANGLQYAQSTVEAFFELVSHGVDAANFWPLAMGYLNRDYRVLIDISDNDLTFGGEVFSMMAQSLSGLQAVFDYERSGEIDVHGFGGAGRMVLFAGERSGSANDNVSLDIGQFLEAHGLSGDYFVTMTHLGEDGTTGTDNRADAVVSWSSGEVASGDILSFDLGAWGLQSIELTAITSGNDVLHGRGGDDNIRGGHGDDRVFGAEGADILRGNQGNDTLNGGEGDDNLIGGTGDDVLVGGQGDDTLRGLLDNDTLRGGGGEDSVEGGGGADRLFGGAGVDTLSGGAGDDRLEGGGQRDLLIGGEGRDWASYNSSRTGVTADLGDISANTGDAMFDRYIGIENLEGSEANDTLSGDDQANVLTGQSGADLLNGRNGNDTLIGGNGADTIMGGNGNDVLSGGAGADLFVAAIGEGIDLILDYTDGSDILQIEGVDSFSDIEILEYDSYVEVHFGDGGSLRLNGINAAQLTASDFDFS